MNESPEFSPTERAEAWFAIVGDGFAVMGRAAERASQNLDGMSEHLRRFAAEATTITKDRRKARRLARVFGGLFITINGRPRVYVVAP